jgi:hypothetical protein
VGNLLCHVTTGSEVREFASCRIASLSRARLSSANVTVRNDDSKRSSAELQAELDAL